MKTQIKTTLLAIAMLASGFLANANEKERTIELTTENKKAVVLNMQNVEVGIKISLWNEAGELLFADEAKSDVYGKVFNLKQMEEGQLTLEIENQESLEILPINVTKLTASLNKGQGIMISKPMVKHNDTSLKVYLGQKCLDMQMTIFDQYGDVVHRSEIEKGDAKVQRYDISDLSNGSYRIQFTAEGRSFYHTISLD